MLPLLLLEEPVLKLPLLLLEEELLGLLTLLLLFEEELLGLLTLLLLFEEELLGLLTLLLLFEEELLGLLALLLLLEEELLGLLTLVLFLFDEELELGLTYSELERTCLLLLAGAYDLRSEDDCLADELLLEGLVALEGRTVVEVRELDGLSLLLEALEGLDEEAGANPADAGLLLLPATCNPP